MAAIIDNESRCNLRLKNNIKLEDKVSCEQSCLIKRISPEEIAIKTESAMNELEISQIPEHPSKVNCGVFADLIEIVRKKSVFCVLDKEKIKEIHKIKVDYNDEIILRGKKSIKPIKQKLSKKNTMMDEEISTKLKESIFDFRFYQSEIEKRRDLKNQNVKRNIAEFMLPLPRLDRCINLIHNYSL